MKVKRLYSSFQPETYDLTLQINEETMTFSGTVVIHGTKTGRPSKRLTFHQKDLTVTKATVTHKDKKGHVVKELARINNHNTYDEVRLHTHDMLFPGAYSVELKFTGSITRNMNGMYPCFYEENGQKKQLIATQFESHHAREVFPCIDEPEAKAVFTLTLKTRKTTVVSNTPIATQKLDGTVQMTTFEPTPIMSTYLLAFVTGDMLYKEAKTARGVAVRTWSTPDNIDYTDFALETAVRCIEFYESFFTIPYPLAKSDLLALPDFASGAMENWGCITFREQCMLVDPANTSVATKQYVAMVVAHELAHMWFGNLVTMRWWTDLWLNEGFASWVEYLATDKLFPEWRMWTQFIADEQQPAMKLDALNYTHPVQVPVNHPDEIRTIFDTISYSKGASVIHQLYSYIGAEAFQRGLNIYLTRHAYKNADTTDLWQAFSEASQKDIGSFMHAWTTLPGFPLVKVAQNGSSHTLQQERFFVERTESPKQSDELWPIPLFNEDLESALLQHRRSDGIITDPLLNHGRSGFYRVAYDTKSLQVVTDQLQQGTMSELDRLGLLADMLEVCKTGDIPTTDTLGFLQHYANEDSAVVWTVIAHIISGIKLVMGSDSVREAIKPYVRQLANKEYLRLGWDKTSGDSYFDVLLRPTIIGLLASADHETVVKKCLECFNTLTAASDETTMRAAFGSIDPDLRAIVLATAARRGVDNAHSTLLKLYDVVTLSEEKLTVANGLTSFTDDEQIDKVLQMLHTEKVRMQDIAYWVTYLLSNFHARQKTWQWVKDNWQWLEKNLGTDLSFCRMPLYVARIFSSKEQLIEYESFFTPLLNPTIQRSYDQGREIILWQTAWRSKDQNAVERFLRQFK